MSIAKKPYELSVWEDVWIEKDSVFKEKRIAIIGSDTMTSQYRALDPKFKTNVNGSNELTFKMYYRCKDSITGETVDNPLVGYLSNERKLKLKYKGKWYDLLIKDIAEDSQNKTYSYTATDQHIVELSKNGYDLVLDAELQNNTGTAIELGQSILRDTDWTVEGEIIPQITTEPLIELTLTGSVIAYPLIDNVTIAPTIGEPVSIGSGEKIYAFYSCCTGKPRRFQFIYSSTYQTNSESIIITKNSQYYIDEPTYVESEDYNIPTFSSKPSFSQTYRGNRYVFSQQAKFNKVLNTYAYAYQDSTQGEQAETIWGIQEVNYYAPNLIKNYIANNIFKSTSGWTGSYIAPSGVEKNKAKLYDAKCKVDTTPSILDALKNGTFSEETTYEPYIELSFKKTDSPAAASTVINSGFYENRKIIKNLHAGQKFVLLYREDDDSQSLFTVTIGERDYSPADGHYSIDDETVYMTFDTGDKPDEIPTTSFTVDGKNRTYKYIVASVNQDYALTETQFLASKAQAFITLKNNEEKVLRFYDFQIIPYVEEEGSPTGFMSPFSQPVARTKTVTYKYYKESSNVNVVKEEDYVFFKEQDQPISTYKPVYYNGAAKVKAVTVKQSNYFNAIQSLCESFECWADFQIEHDENGLVTRKKVYIKNYIGKDNFAGFRAGVNLKQVQRQKTSKSIVTKLIVPSNNNEYATDGLCSIARSSLNETGESYIYNFRYYIQQGLLSEEKLNKALYGDAIVEGGYYPYLKSINKAAERANERMTRNYQPLLQARADVTIARNGVQSAKDLYQEAAADFLRATGFMHTEINKAYKVNEEGKYIDSEGKVIEDQTDASKRVIDEKEIKRREKLIEDSSAITGYVVSLGEQFAALQKFEKDLGLAAARQLEYESQYNKAYDELERNRAAKETLNLLFYKKFYRFIQEGTWKSEDYVDDNLYYIDAKSTMYNSCFPQVTYTFNVLEISQLEGYEDFNFALGDKTFAEDPEFFGYVNGVPYREEVILSEITYSLDEPDKDSIKVQNFKNQFQDLFQKITASVQSLSYASGAYDRAASSINASTEEKAEQIQLPLYNSSLDIRNAGEQSVVWDERGIITFEPGAPGEALRIANGAIMFRDTSNPIIEWTTLLTPRGINAKLITAGQINTKLLQIMNGDEPYFRWDTYGITAYEFGTNPNQEFGVNTNKGVRFDRFGIYGYNGVDGSMWHPADGDDIRKNSLFALTWDGVWLNLGTAKYSKYYYLDDNGKSTSDNLTEPIWHKSTAKIGKTNEYIYNSWSNEGIPYYNPEKEANTFVKVFAIGSGEDNEEMAIYDDGTLVAKNIKFTGTVQWTELSSPSKTLYAKKRLSVPANGTKYTDFDEEGEGWHQNYLPEDIYYCHTDNAGATWKGPILVTGRGIIGQEVEYVVGSRGWDPAKITSGWSTTFPTNIQDGQCLYTRVRDQYNSGDFSIWSYTVGYFGTSNYRLEIKNDFASLVADELRVPKNPSWSMIIQPQVLYSELKQEGWGYEITSIDNEFTSSSTGDGKLIVSLADPKKVLQKDEYVIGISASDGDITLVGSAKIVVLQGGEKGSDAIGYSVKDIPAVITRKVNEPDEPLQPASFTAHAWKTVGNSTLPVPCTGEWRYQIDGGSEKVLPGLGASGTFTSEQYGQAKNTFTISFYETDEEGGAYTIPRDSETITIVSDGINGSNGTSYTTQTSLTAIPFNHNGTLKASTLTITPIGRKDGDEFTPECQVLYSKNAETEGTEADIDADNPGARRIDLTKLSLIQTDYITITIRGEYNDSITLYPSVDGADGTTPVIYSIIASPSSINTDADGHPLENQQFAFSVAPMEKLEEILTEDDEAAKIIVRTDKAIAEIEWDDPVFGVETNEIITSFTCELVVHDVVVAKDTIVVQRQGATGATGAPGTNGTDGKGISNITNYYGISKDSTQPTTWVKEKVPTGYGEDSPNLWNKEVITYTDGSSETVGPTLMTVWGKTGAGITRIDATFAVSEERLNKDEAEDLTFTADGDSDWSETNKYLYEKTTFTYSSGDAQSIVALKGVWGREGSTGSQGNQSEFFKIYYGSNDYAAPTKPEFEKTDDIETPWFINMPKMGEGTGEFKFCYVSTGIKTTVFNRDGTYVASLSNWSEPELAYAYSGSGAIPNDTYATFVRLTNNGEKKAIEYSETGEMFINATYIQTGLFQVKQNENTIFAAGMDSENNPKVEMVGFNAGYIAFTDNNNPARCFYSNIQDGERPNEGTFIICPDGIPNYTEEGLKYSKIIIGNNFRIDKNGELYASGAKFNGGIIEAGEIIGSSITGSSILIKTKIKNEDEEEEEVTLLSCSTKDALFVRGLYSTDDVDIKGSLKVTDALDISGTSYLWNLQVSGASRFSSDGLFEQAIYFDTNRRHGFQIGTADIGTTTENITAHVDVNYAPGTFQGMPTMLITCTLSQANSSGTDINIDGLIMMVRTSGILQEQYEMGWSVTINNGKSSGQVVLKSLAGWKFAGAPFGYKSPVSWIKKTTTSDKFVRIIGQYLASQGSTYSILMTYQSILFKKSKDWSETGSIVQQSSYMELGGQWKVVGSLTTGDGGTIDASDARVKNSISHFANEYDVLFDALIPCRFKYNKGTSDRYHSGFIAQEVAQAIEKAGLSTQDFAAYVDGKHIDGTAGLRYAEFVALNTWQIQKLKPRMTAAEQKILALELEVQTLKSALENLQKS